MTYTDATQRNDYTATSGQTVFAYDFRILTEAELKVYDDGTLKTLTTDYTISNVGSSGGGNVTFVTGITLDNPVLLIRATPDTQNTDYTASGPFAANDHETALDKLTMHVQDMEEKHSRSLKFPITSTLSDIDYPEGSSATDGAGKVAAWNSTRTALELLNPTVIDAVSVIAVKGDIVQGDASGDAAKLGIGSTGGLLHVVSGLLAYLGIGSSGQVLTVANGQPSWASVTGTAKNKIINGGMSVSQRGASFTATGSANDDDSYTLDRWNLLSDGNDIVDVTQQTAGGVSTEEAYIRLDVETALKKFGILQVIENKNLKDLTSDSDVVSLSFEAKVTNATKLSDIRAAVVSWDSTADTVTSDIVSAWGAEGSNFTPIANWTLENTPANLSVTTSWARYTIENIAIDTASTKNIGVFIWQNNVATNDTAGVFLEITNVQLEKGDTANTFEYRDIGSERTKCKRYYERHAPVVGGNTSPIGTGWVKSSTVATVYWMFEVEKRITPVASFGAANDDFLILHQSASTATSAALTFSSEGSHSVQITATVAGGLTAGEGCGLTINDTTNGFVDVDAEL